MDDLHKLLHSYDFFKDLSAEELQGCGLELSTKTYQAGDPIFLISEVSQSVFFVIEGQVEVFCKANQSQPKLFREVENGQYFGEISVLTNSSHTFSAYAKEETKVLAIEGVGFINMLNLYPALSQKLMSSLAYELHSILSDSYAVRPISENMFEFSPLMPQLVPYGWLKNDRVLPVHLWGNILHVAMVHPFSEEFFEKFEKNHPDYDLLISTIDQKVFDQKQEEFQKLYQTEMAPKKECEDCDPFGASRADLKEFLQFSLMFSQFSADILDQLLPYFEARSFQAGEVIYEANRPAHEMFLIKSGQVDLIKQVPEQSLMCHVETARTYDSIGEVSILTQSWYHVSAIAAKPTEAYCLRKEVMEELFKFPEFTVPLCMSLANRIKAVCNLPGVDLNVQADMSVTSITELTKTGDLSDYEEDFRLDLKSKEVAPLLKEILDKAVSSRTSDVHVEPKEDHYIIRCRIDGTMTQIWKQLDRDRGDALVNHMKILSELDITEKRYPQDGQFISEIANRDVNVRFATTPIKHGEKVVLRILMKSTNIIPLAHLAQSTNVIKFLNGLTRYKQGLFLVAGPTGSGKTSTLYSVLNELNGHHNNVVTVEDPVELEMDGINQTQINNGIGLNYHVILKHLLRQDPDVILIGEIRDPESLQMVFEASLTGHLVLATIHATTSTDTVARLLELGASLPQISSSLIGVLSQRLIRANCSGCTTKRSITEEEQELLSTIELKKVPTELSYGKGCKKCNSTGYYGRLPIFEYWQQTPEIKDALLGSDLQTFREKVNEMDFETLSEYGLRMVANGLTTIEEVESSLFGLNNFSPKKIKPAA